MADHYAFLVSESRRIEPEVYRIKYPSIQYPMLVPVDTTASEWASGITYYSQDSFGEAQYLANRATDIPLADIRRSMHEVTVEAATIGYDYSVQELELAMMLRQPLTTDKANAARLAAEKMIDRIVLYGESEHGWDGLLNCSGVHNLDLEDTERWKNATTTNATADKIIADVNDLLTGVWSDSKTVETADTLAMPTTIWSFLANTPRSATSDITILNFIKENNVYTALSGRPLMVIAIRGLENVTGVTGQRIMAYRRDPQALKLHMPMSFRFFAPQLQIFKYIVPGMFRLGGLEVRLPGSMRYLSNVDMKPSN